MEAAHSGMDATEGSDEQQQVWQTAECFYRKLGASRW